MKRQRSNSAPYTEPELHQVLERIADLISSGERVDVDAYVASMPEHTEQLRDFIASMQSPL